MLRQKYIIQPKFVNLHHLGAKNGKIIENKKIAQAFKFIQRAKNQMGHHGPKGPHPGTSHVNLWTV